MSDSIFAWRRGPRSHFALPSDPGVYALFLKDGAVIPQFSPGENGLIYVGLAANKHGLKGRCHFDARTRNHSPRKSLAVLLMSQLELVPILITKPNSSDTWGLDKGSDARLSAWMHENLELAIELRADPVPREAELIARHAPPLNLRDCELSIQHLRLLSARAQILGRLRMSQ